MKKILVLLSVLVLCSCSSKNLSFINPINNGKIVSDFDENKGIYSISISENGDFAIVTNEHFYASNSTDYDNMITAKDMFGQLKDVCITNKGITVVCQNGIYYHNIPTSVEERLKTCTERPDHIRFTDSGTFLISYENGIGYRYYM